MVQVVPAFIVPTGAGFRGYRTCQRLLWSSGRVFRCFRPLSRFVFGGLVENMPLFRVLRAFLARFWGVCVGLCCSGACVACGAFVCVNS